MKCEKEANRGPRVLGDIRSPLFGQQSLFSLVERSATHSERFFSATFSHAQDEKNLRLTGSVWNEMYQMLEISRSERWAPFSRLFLENLFVRLSLFALCTNSESCSIWFALYTVLQMKLSGSSRGKFLASWPGSCEFNFRSRKNF